MPSLYKKPIVVFDAATGEKVTKKSAKWWGRYRDAEGRDKRVPLARDKVAAQAMLLELVKKAELQTAGLSDPFDDHARTPLSKHIDAFERHVRSKGNTLKHVKAFASKVRAVSAAGKWKSLSHISASAVEGFLAAKRQGGLSIQATNHYLRAIKSFTRWLVRDRRTKFDPLIHLAMQNPKLDQRHQRRALAPDEFARLVAAAESGPRVEMITGPDRAMMYLLAAWTGYRKGEIGSLSRRSFALDANPPTVTVSAAYSKRRREDVQVLHPAIAERMKAWLEKRSATEQELLFPVSRDVPGGTDRKTSKMMQRDLAAARKAWINEAAGAREHARRATTDFLKYQDSLGRFADFHSNRHTFITSLERAGVSPRLAQSLARHSDIRLTMNVYTHVGREDQAAAIQSLPPPRS